MTETKTEHRRKPRSDAQKNRQKILDVASQLFDKGQLEISMSTLAQKAGIGAGTLYRNFPNREALIAAVLEEKGLGAPDFSETTQKTALDKVTAWLEALADWFTTYEGLTDPMRRAVEEAQTPLGMKCYDVIAQLDDLLQEAKAEGAIKDGVTGRDLYLATLGIAWAAQHSDNPDRLYELLARGWMA
ncbi:TetR/AcrR family transcriptional regulator [Rothia terrae]|uniref:TetR/AcrR family transcriptional regulator n=1 Tax=Rothia terrae TaxID=396015 RepID=UPI00288176BD|nr:TetR/AcrR family transcriptional regulator [Rothia terrae]MDT0188745.1 TetR/AcrR family transcriptional regulator [Rothia terrae]